MQQVRSRGQRGDVRRSEPTVEAAPSRPRVKITADPAPTSTKRMLGTPDTETIDKEINQLMKEDPNMSLEEAIDSVNYKYGLGKYAKRQKSR